ncbi:MAG: T9SS type A sorting domain-containing protein, partial [Calditrichaeota bacterium]|nr:T9SS type A sorting domain-containing protein [Calditrichota bacterium]
FLFAFCVTNVFAALHTPALDAALASAPDDIPIRIVLFLRDSEDSQGLYSVAKALRGDERRAYVIQERKAQFESVGMPLIERLVAGQETGSVSRVRPLWAANAIVCEIAPAFLRECEEQHPEIEWILYDRRFDNTLDEEKELWTPPSHLDDIAWGVADIGAVRVWEEFGIFGQGVIVGMMDSGVDTAHPDLVSKIWLNPGEDLNGNGTIDAGERNGIDDDGNGYKDDFRGWNFDDDNNNIGDRHGHGTSTAGIVAGGWTVCDTVGVAPGATLMILSGYEFQSSCWLAMQYAIENGAHLISASLSFKFTECESPYFECPNVVVWRRMTEMELAAGLVHVNSVGNAGIGLGAPLSIPVPANCPPPWLSPAQQIQGGVSSIIAVSGYLSTGEYFAPSGRGPSAWSDEDLCFHPSMPHCQGNNWPMSYDDYPYQCGLYMGLLKPEICAPAVARTLARWSGCREGFQGTSAAAPHIGGTVALIMSATPGISPEEVCRVLKLTARDAGAPGEDSLFGAGKVDAYAAVAFVLDSLGEVTGLVTDNSTGLPLQDVRVSTRNSRAVFTGVNGVYHLFLRPGQDTVRFYRYGYEQGSELVTISGGGTLTLNKRLPVAELGTLQGTIYNSELQPQVGVFVRILDTPLAALQTNQSGVYQRDMAEGIYQAVAYADWLEAATQTVVITASQTTVQDFHLEDSPRILPTGPDSHGYFAWDNVDSGGMPYEWMEISPAQGGPGTLLSLEEDELTTVPLPFNFVFYGNSYDTLSVTENGFVVFGASQEGDWQHYPIPSVSGPGRLAAPLWTDFLADADGASYAYYFDASAHRFIIEWNSALFFSWDHRRATFQVILYDPQFYGTLTGDGPILFQYGRVDFDMYCAVGIENGSENDGIQYLFNTTLDSHAAGLCSGRSILFSPPRTSAVPLAKGVPSTFYFAPCWPNPFNPKTTFEWGMPKAAQIRMEVFDILGRRTAVIAEGFYPAGNHRRTFDGSGLPTGVYFVRLDCDGISSQTQKILLLK